MKNREERPQMNEADLKKALQTGPLHNGPFQYLSKNGTGLHALLETLREHYAKLSVVYRSKEMNFEAELFEGIADDYEAIRQRIKDYATTHEA
jgi:hypothetical protein